MEGYGQGGSTGLDQTALGKIQTGFTPADLSVTRGDADILRRLAKRVAETAHRSEMDDTRTLWKKLNRLEKVRPLVLCDPENGRNEIITKAEMACRGKLARRWEMGAGRRRRPSRQTDRDRVAGDGEHLVVRSCSPLDPSIGPNWKARVCGLVDAGSDMVRIVPSYTSRTNTTSFLCLEARGSWSAVGYPGTWGLPSSTRGQVPLGEVHRAREREIGTRLRSNVQQHDATIPSICKEGFRWQPETGTCRP